MDLSLVFQVLFTVVFVLGVVLALYCVFTIHKNPHINKTEKLVWLLLALALPIFGPIAWISKMRMEKKYAQQDATQPAEHAHPAN
ncbi:PLDc N-terminal domain-containing protein [Rothia terrae]|uniref:PLDc N-terminal domain-containing protein n=1 Tax=Rothia terrae TaxID=396015 RepID=UPI002882AA71|nr:PLDc N-terminal domain-containing protein [Rothia terrae]MDT0190726.1 PLDc N-terminal domain-containing protein [Rothia terrae]